MVEQHPHGDLTVPLVRHAKLRQIGGDRFVEIDFCFVDQQHDCGGDIDFADRTDIEAGVLVDRDVLQPVGHTESFGVNQAPVVGDGDGRAAILTGGDRLPDLAAGNRHGVDRRRRSGVGCRDGRQDQQADGANQDQGEAEQAVHRFNPPSFRCFKSNSLFVVVLMEQNIS